MAQWFVDAVLGAPSTTIAEGYIADAWRVCDGISAALTKSELPADEREAIEEGLASVRRRLQGFDARARG